MDLQPVIWSEGLLLTPQHFQQQERYLQRVCLARYESCSRHAVGFRELHVDTQLLRQGKIALLQARGILPDLTPFDMPSAQPLPPPVDIDSNMHNHVIYLALPLQQGDARRDSQRELARFDIGAIDIHDDCSPQATVQHIDVGQPNFRLLIGHGEHGCFSCLPVARIRAIRDDGSVLLDDAFIPPALSLDAATTLRRAVAELATLLQQQADAVAARLCSGSDIHDLQQLPLLNRNAVLIAHFAQHALLHPYELYLQLLQLCAEIATFRHKGMVPPPLPGYHHLDLQHTFDPLLSLLRELLQRSADHTAQPIPLLMQGQGIRTAKIDDLPHAGNARLILAVSADLGIEQLRTRFPPAAKLAPAARIRQLVNLQLPGMTLNPLAAPPRQITFDGRCCYFEVDRSTLLWQELKAGGSLALHVADGLPGLATMLWLLRD